MREYTETHSATEFSNPYFVLVHTSSAIKDKILRKRGSFKRALAEIENIKRNHPYSSIDDKTSPDTIPENLPKNQPILVTGFFRDICVRQQKDALIRAGYNAYIAKEGSYSINN
jgi:hypothetical protein